MKRHYLRTLVTLCCLFVVGTATGADPLLRIPPGNQRPTPSQSWTNALQRPSGSAGHRSQLRPALVPPASPPSQLNTRIVSLPAASESAFDGAPLPQEPTSGFLTEGLQTDVTINIEQRQRERNAQFRQLRQQLERLKERLELSPPIVVPAEPPGDTIPEAPQQTVNRPDAPVEGDPSPENDVADNKQPGPDEMSAPAPLIVQPKPSSVFADSLAAQAMVEGPVDRVGLADNLYALEELQIALEMYQQVEMKELPASERYWVTYQTASCLRRLKKIPEAKETYRRLAGRKDAGWLAKMATWWLGRMDARDELEQSLSQQKKILDAFSEVYDEPSVE